MTTELMWDDETQPKCDGWYARHYSWDAREGSFTDVEYWCGKWRHDRPILQIAGPFDTEEDAQKFADENDITW